MHELSIAQSLVEELDAITIREGALRVNSFRLDIGAISGVEQHALEMALPFAAEGSNAEGATFDINIVVTRVKCKGCGNSWEPETFIGRCRSCDSNDIAIVAGREMVLVSVELET